MLENLRVNLRKPLAGMIILGLGLLLSAVGVSPVTFKRGEHADMDSWTRPYSESEREQLMRQIS